MPHYIKKSPYILFIILLITLFSATLFAHNLSIHYLDVGQGDSILIQTPDQHSLLIDGGPRSAGNKVVSYLNDQGIDRVDYIISTHPHADHIGGLIAILENFPVEKVIDSGRLHTSQTYEDYLTTIDQKDIPYQQGRAGDTFSLGHVEFTILHPDQVDYDLNNSSIVLKMEYDETSFLFAGDAEKAAETTLLDAGQNLKAHFLKVGHHGSKTSTSSAFLSAVDPVEAIIMCGANNRYGHPDRETVSRLTKQEVDVYRTDRHGTIILESDGDSYSISTEKESAAITDPEKDTPETTEKDKGKFVGSSESDKYHYPDCRWAKNIKPKNEIWFDSVTEALNAGYKPCGSCTPPASE